VTSFKLGQIVESIEVLTEPERRGLRSVLEFVVVWGDDRGRCQLADVVNLPSMRCHDGHRDDGSENDRRILREFGEFDPNDDLAANCLRSRDSPAEQVLRPCRAKRN
jgi:hypothetical protein